MTKAQQALLDSTTDELIRLELSRVFAMDAHFETALEAASRRDWSSFDQAMTSFRNLQGEAGTAQQAPATDR